jgi:hypothetical protein
MPTIQEKALAQTKQSSQALPCGSTGMLIIGLLGGVAFARKKGWF